MKPKIIIPRGLGINSQEELKRIFEIAGADVDYILWNDLINNPKVLDSYQGAGLAGGFAMGDHLGAGQSLANRIRLSGLRDKLQEKVEDPDFPIYGVCNSLQLLAKLDLFPIGVGTVKNDTGKHETGYWDLEMNRDNDIAWFNYLKQIDEPIFAPISHGEGRVAIPDEKDLAVAQDTNLIALRYTNGHMCDFYRSSRGNRYNPNGSIDDIAGFGWNNNLVLFPHFERSIQNVQRPDKAQLDDKQGHYLPTLLLFKAAVDFIKGTEKQ